MRITDIRGNTRTKQLLKRAADFIVFSIVIDDSTNINDVVEFTMIIRGVDEDLIVPFKLHYHSRLYFHSFG